MKRKPLLATILFVFCFIGLGISQSDVSAKPANVKVEETKSESVKPADGIPAKFSSKEELESAVPLKTAKIKEMIQSGQYSGDRLRVLREELWRFENAIVVKP